MNIGIILQARMGSNRLPGKILRPVGGRPMLIFIIDRLSHIQHPVRVVVATSNSLRDDVVEEFCRTHSFECFRGSEKDVLERYYRCAEHYGFDHIVRLTGDNPFVDIEELDRLVDLHLEKQADYSHSYDVLPVGAQGEIFTFESLERSFMYGTAPNHREHVNEYIQENPGLFRIEVLQVPPSKNRPDVRLTVDTDEDYLRARFIAERSAGGYISTEEAIRLYSHFERMSPVETVHI